MVVGSFILRYPPVHLAGIEHGKSTKPFRVFTIKIVLPYLFPTPTSSPKKTSPGTIRKEKNPVRFNSDGEFTPEEWMVGRQTFPFEMVPLFKEFFGLL